MHDLRTLASELLQPADATGGDLTLRAAVRTALRELTALAMSADPGVAAPGRGYERHLLHRGGALPFSVWAIVWAPGAATPLHDHHCWCVMGLGRGRLVERRFRSGPAPIGRTCLRGVQERILEAGTIGTLEAGPAGIHQLRNVSAEPALSIHAYGFDPEQASGSVGTVFDDPEAEAVAGAVAGPRRMHPLLHRPPA